MNKKILKMNLGDRMKYYESRYEMEVKPEQHIVVRIDGHHFSSYTKGFEKPFDDILSKAFELTCKDLLTEFNAVTAYTQSDEITLIIPSLMNTEKHKGTNKPLWKHGYSGRVQKMASLIAGFTTMKFNKYFEILVEMYGADNDYDERYRFLMDKAGNAWFDARVFGVDSDEEAFNSVMWRCRDAQKNSISMFAQTYCSHKELQHKNGLEQAQYCKEKTGKDWETVSDRYKYGILFKREKYLKPVDSASMDYAQNDFVERSRVVSWSEKITSFSEEDVKMIMRKYK